MRYYHQKNYLLSCKPRKMYATVFPLCSMMFYACMYVSTYLVLQHQSSPEFCWEKAGQVWSHTEIKLLARNKMVVLFIGSGEKVFSANTLSAILNRLFSHDRAHSFSRNLILDKIFFQIKKCISTIPNAFQFCNCIFINSNFILNW